MLHHTIIHNQYPVCTDVGGHAWIDVCYLQSSINACLLNVSLLVSIMFV